MGAEPLLVGDLIPVSARPEGLYQRAVPEHHAVMARLSQGARVSFLDLGTAVALTDDIRVQDKRLNAEGQRRQAELLFGVLRATGLIDRLLARPRETGVGTPDLCLPSVDINGQLPCAAKKVSPPRVSVSSLKPAPDRVTRRGTTCGGL
jgi:hypothetical protein